ncbi:hypothetical protein PMALA_028520 [Plasmodium malariae]|uniref:MORN repeat protein n=1 Tax=Plasmodium malariae TaxID=5858 RepID=A0A1A8WE65_PLAMA|nr:hypothetical protein PMALA_028520 [Plasmodium malariae]
MKYLSSKPIFVFCDLQEIEIFLQNDKKANKEEEDKEKKKKTCPGISELWNSTCIVENSLIPKANDSNEVEKIECCKLLPCYIEIINSDLLLYFFDNYSNKICWKINKGKYSLETEKMVSNEHAQHERRTDKNKMKKQKQLNHKVRHEDHITHDNEQEETLCTVISTNENGDISCSSFNNDLHISQPKKMIKKRKKKRKKSFENYALLEDEGKDNELNKSYLKNDINCFLKFVHFFSYSFRNMKDDLKRNTCFFFMCNEEEEEYGLNNSHLRYINLFIKINPSFLSLLRNRITINDNICYNLSKTNKYLICERMKEVSLNFFQIFEGDEKITGEMCNLILQNECSTPGTFQNEKNKIQIYSEHSNILPNMENETANLNTLLESPYMNNNEFEDDTTTWYELKLFTYTFHKKRVEKLMKNYKKCMELENESAYEDSEMFEYQKDEEDMTTLDTGLNYKINKDQYTHKNKSTVNEVWRYDPNEKLSEKECNKGEGEQSTISYLLSSIEKLRSTTFLKRKFMEDPTQIKYKELIFYDKNKEFFCKYVGNMKDRLYNGKGKLYDKFNSLIYDGDWLNAERNGKGKLLFKHFNIWYLYEGEFMNDEIVDKGIISLIDKEYVKRIQTNKINKLCPLLIKANFGRKKKLNDKDQKQNLSKQIMNQIEKTAMQDYSSTNNVDFWPQDIVDIYFPYLKKWNIYSFYCSSNIENIKKKKDIFESNENNFRNLIGYPSYNLSYESKFSSSLAANVIEGDQNIYAPLASNASYGKGELGIESSKQQDEQNDEQQDGQIDGQQDDLPNDEATKSNSNSKWTFPINGFTKKKEKQENLNEDLVYKHDKTNILHERFFEYMKMKNEQKLYFPLLSKNIGLTKIIYADKSEYFGPINNRGQPNTNEQFPKAFFNNEKFFYKGEMKNFLPHGYGIFKNKDENKNTYLGFWKNGYREGNGSLNLKNRKYIVQGNFVKDRIHDKINIYIKDEKISKLHLSNINKSSQKIKIFFRNGYIFYGYFSQNYERNGIGILIDSNNKILYHGYYKNDVIDKFCYILRHKDNTIYCGNLQQGFKKGFGKLYYEEKLQFNEGNENEFNLSLSNAKILARKLEAYDGVDINSDIPLKFSFDSNHVIYIGYWDKNAFSHFGSCNLKNGIYKGDIKDSKKDGLGIYIYKKKKSYKNKNRYVLSYFKKDKIQDMGKYYSEYDKMKVYPFEKEQIKHKSTACDKCFNKENLQCDILKTDKLYINQELDSYITIPLRDLLSNIMNELFDKSTSFTNYLHRPFHFDLNYFLKK